MTEDRFQNRDSWIQERSVTGTTYFLDEQDGVNALCSRINGLYDYSKRLEKSLNGLVADNKQFHNIARDYNIPFDKLCETFEDVLDENERLKQQNQRVLDLIDKYIDECRQGLTEVTAKTEKHRLEFMIHCLEDIKKGCRNNSDKAGGLTENDRYKDDD